MVTPSNGCGIGTPRTLSVTVNTTAGLIDYSILSNVNLYPNPNSGIFTFEVGAPANYKVKIINLIGQEIYNQTLNETQDIYLDNIQNGIYYVNISTDKGSAMKKIIVR